jgi:hypothetical protein
MSLFINNSVIDNKTLCEQFCKRYYIDMSNGGFSSVLKYFSPSAKCTLNNHLYNGAYDLLIKFTEDTIHKFTYKKVSGNYQQINSNILITTSGICNPINFQKQQGKELIFTETFILTKENDSYFITNYICILHEH